LVENGLGQMERAVGTKYFPCISRP